jgi:hypothetical protein
MAGDERPAHSFHGPGLPPQPAAGCRPAAAFRRRRWPRGCGDPGPAGRGRRGPTPPAAVRAHAADGRASGRGRARARRAGERQRGEKDARCRGGNRSPTGGGDRDRAARDSEGGRVQGLRPRRARGRGPMPPKLNDGPADRRGERATDRSRPRASKRSRGQASRRASDGLAEPPRTRGIDGPPGEGPTAKPPNGPSERPARGPLDQPRGIPSDRPTDSLRPPFSRPLRPCRTPDPAAPVNRLAHPLPHLPMPARGCPPTCPWSRPAADQPARLLPGPLPARRHGWPLERPSVRLSTGPPGRRGDPRFCPPVEPTVPTCSDQRKTPPARSPARAPAPDCVSHPRTGPDA